MQLIISKQTAKAAMTAIVVFADSIAEKKPDGSVDHEKLKALLKRCNLTPKDYLRLGELVQKLDNKLNQKPNKNK